MARADRSWNHGKNKPRIRAIVRYQTGTETPSRLASARPRTRLNALVRLPRETYTAPSHKHTRVDTQMSATAPGFRTRLSFLATCDGSATQFIPEKFDNTPS